MTRLAATAVVVLALLCGSIGTAAAQDTTAPTTTTSTATPTPSTTTSSATASSTTPATSSTASATTPPDTAAAPPVRNTPPNTTPPRTTTSRTTWPIGAAAGAAAPPDPTPAPTSTADEARSSALVPWLPADDHPWIGALAVALMVGSGTAFVVILERRPRRRQ